MFGPAIDTAISLILMYLVLSLACTALQEWVAKIFELRSKNLETGLKSLMSDPVARDFLESPQMIGLNRAGPRSASSVRTWFKSEFGISNVPSERFVSYLFKNFDDAKSSLENIDAAIDAIPTGSPEADRIKALLEGFKAEVAGEVDAFKTRVENWFDESMSTLGGWYARNVQVILFFIGLFVAVSLNASTLIVAQKVWDDADLRGSLVTAATKIAEAQDTSALKDLSREDLVALQLQLPIGWPEGCGYKNFANDDCTGFDNFLVAIFGWLITAVALSLGAKFWFDLLKSLINIRGDGSAGRPASRSFGGTPTSVTGMTAGSTATGAAGGQN